MNRFHVHVNVTDLDRSITFYSQLFGADPSVVKSDYAKWMLDDPHASACAWQVEIALACTCLLTIATLVP